ncbi:Hypothetical protein LUCI_2111 [Lucifera butyrica]|uniref:Type iv pilin n-term methylation site gfxxxe n=1 Tax=Lucifera butyrica TaxID=1351585 RepID=A0A498R5Z0_9FIRM|nr:hypothetical protein [Lucifera butyrica]VBB06874.1 Hypothetical protein LUCI_2111 [Lucifera butyrica]
MKRVVQTQSGIMLVELLVGLLIGTLLLSAAVSILSTSVTVWQTGISRADLQETARIAVDTIIRDLRYATSVTLNSATGTITIIRPDGDTVIYGVNSKTQTLCQTINNGSSLPFAGNGVNNQPGNIRIVPNSGDTAMFTSPADKQLRVLVTVQDGSTGITVALESSIVCLGARNFTVN